MKTKLTIKEIAHLAEVSIGTVDRAMNNRPGINETTKHKVLKIAEENGYQANRFASVLSKQKKLKIAVVAPFSTYISYDIERGMKQAQQDLSEFSLELEFFYTSDFEPKKQVETLKKINLDNFDALLINACGESVESFFDDFKQKGIPVATFNSDVTSGKRVFYIGQNNYKGGLLAGGLVCRFDCTKKIIVFNGFNNVDAHKMRYNGFCDAIKNAHPNAKICGPIEYYDDERYARNVAYQTFIKEENSVGIVFVTSAPGTVGVLEAAKEVYKNGMPIIIGYDYNKEVREFLSDGSCFATIYQSPFLQGYVAVKMMLEHVMFAWKPQNDNIFVAPRIILKQNAEYFDADENDIGNYFSINSIKI